MASFPSETGRGDGSPGPRSVFSSLVEGGQGRMASEVVASAYVFGAVVWLLGLVIGGVIGRAIVGACL